MQKLIKQSLEVQNDTMVTAKNVIAKPATLNSTERGVMNEQEENNSKPSSPNPLKLSEKKNPTVKTIEKPKTEEKKTPKAVMKRN